MPKGIVAINLPSRKEMKGPFISDPYMNALGRNWFYKPYSRLLWGMQIRERWGGKLFIGINPALCLNCWFPGVE